MMHHEKSDEIDTAAISDLLRRGEGTPFKPVKGVYLQLQHLDRVRFSKVKIRTVLQNQVIGHLDRIFPGLVIIAEPNDRMRALLAQTPYHIWTKHKGLSDVQVAALAAGIGNPATIIDFPHPCL